MIRSIILCGPTLVLTTWAVWSFKGGYKFENNRLQQLRICMYDILKLAFLWAANAQFSASFMFLFKTNFKTILFYWSLPQYFSKLIFTNQWKLDWWRLEFWMKFLLLLEIKANSANWILNNSSTLIEKKI